jgi:tetratricopeptide (TPR) repeat protein
MVSATSLQTEMNTMVDHTRRQNASVALLDLGSKLFTEGNQDDAMSMFDAAFHVLSTSCTTQVALCTAQLQWGNQRLTQSQEKTLIQHPVDTYHEDECDVGPRPFCKAVVPRESMHYDLLQMSIWYNKALIHHSKNEFPQALQMYQAVVGAVTTALSTNSEIQPNDSFHLGMRAYNNIGQISYAEKAEDAALIQFETALMFAKRVVDDSSKHRLDCAAILSNWCRVRWMMGDVGDKVLHALREVLRIRFSVLGWDHVDVAAAHYNLGMSEYVRQNNETAMSHLMQYLQVSAHRAKIGEEPELDPIPALLYVLLIKNDDKDDKMAQDLVRGLRTLQDKRQDLGPQNSEVASVLNFIGTLLFHQRELEHALIFFQEELRLEEQVVDCEDDASVSVTCNNIGRILQELLRFPEAIYYYQRSLKPEFGQVVSGGTECCKIDFSKSIELHEHREVPPATMNLYSTVWYNLGLIHDKMGAYADAIKAFQMSLKLRRSMLGPDHADVACLLYNIGVLQMEQQLLKEATDSFREALRIRRVAATGQLNDRHVVKTLQKLASLHKSKGNVAGALEACREVLHVLEISVDFEVSFRNRDMGSTMREIAELHHAQGDLEKALEMAAESVRLVRVWRDDGCNSCTDRFACVEQETAALLLVGSLQHERCEQTEAFKTFTEAARLIQINVLAATTSPSPTSSQASLLPLLEVSNLLAFAHCAPEA